MTGERDSYYSIVNDPLSRQRVDAVLDAYELGKRQPQDLLIVSRNKHKELTKIIGNESENKFMEWARQMPIVKLVRDASSNDDYNNGIDAWIDFQEFIKLSSIPAQIKSSEHGINLFKNSDKFKELHGIVMVINCGHKITKKNFQRQFNSELNRIRKIREV